MVVLIGCVTALYNLALWIASTYALAVLIGPLPTITLVAVGVAMTMIAKSMLSDEKRRLDAITSMTRKNR